MQWEASTPVIRCGARCLSPRCRSPVGCRCSTRSPMRRHVGHLGSAGTWRGGASRRRRQRLARGYRHDGRHRQGEPGRDHRERRGGDRPTSGQPARRRPRPGGPGHEQRQASRRRPSERGRGRQGEAPRRGQAYRRAYDPKFGMTDLRRVARRCTTGLCLAVSIRNGSIARSPSFLSTTRL